MYLTDALNAIAENTGMALNSGGRHMAKRYADLVNPKARKAPRDTRTGDEIAADIIGRLTKGN